MTSTNFEKLKKISVICGELCQSHSCSSDTVNLLNYNKGGIEANIITRYDKFIERPELLENKIIDLLQIASYIFCADRQSNRGKRDSLANQAWGRTFEFDIPVLDIEFWSKASTIEALQNALTYMTGDRNYSFNFVQETANNIKDRPYQVSLFSDTALDINNDDEIDIMLFSGGLDSLAGAIERLNKYPHRKLCLVSHVSNNRTKKTQRTLVFELRKEYGDRIHHYTFECSFKKLKSKEESQRTRMFLFSAIAFLIGFCCHKSEIFIYENGVTSINLPKQMDLMNARASRTTHPKTLALLQCFYRCFDANFQFHSPYKKFTKEEVVKVFKEYKVERLIQSSVSCSSTRRNNGLLLHCGWCSQCIDRRIAVFAAGLADEFDFELTLNLGNIPLSPEEVQRVYCTHLFASGGIGESKYDFFLRYPTELLDVIEHWGSPFEESLDQIYSLYQRYRDSVERAETAMEDSIASLSFAKGSFLEYVSEKSKYDHIASDRFEKCIASSIYVIWCESEDYYSQGSGFFLDDYGVLTSHHVVKKRDCINVAYYHNYPNCFALIFKNQHTICEDEIVDYALYSIVSECEDCFQLGDSDSLKIGDPVKLIGFPNFIQGDSYALIKTEIEAKTSFMGALLYAVNGNVRHGASGGIVLDSNNLIVGLIMAGADTTDTEASSGAKHGFIPINTIINDVQSKGG